MLKKLTMCVAFLIVFLCPYSTNVFGETVRVNVLPPDSLRIPATISLLKATPFYADPSDFPSHPIATIAAQDDIQVLAGVYKWARGRSWWKITTWLGPEWISPEPWTVDIPPPKKITLLINTPVYSTKNDTKAPSATLLPQEVEVLKADKQWFYSNNKNEKKWVYIHTAQYGDKWVHLPVERIGYVKPVDYYYYYASQTLLDDPNYSGSYGSMAGPLFGSILNKTAHVIGEFVNVYNTRYQLETSSGPKFVLEKGVPALIANEELTLKSDTALFAYPLGQTTFLVLHPQTLTSFEKFADSSRYHVHTSLGDAWVNPDFSEPTDATKTTESIELSGKHNLYQFPLDGFEFDGLSLNNETIHPTAFWKDPQGTTWYLIETKDGKAWLNLNPVHDWIS